MWTLKAWQGRFVGRALPAGERLRAYAGWCTAVEGNTTFYATPSRETVASWAAQTSPSFRFVVKLPRTVTHERRLAGAELGEFWHAMEPLGPRTHAYWIQLPGSFGPGDLSVLETFLQGLPSNFRYAVEVRHRGFFADPRPLLAVLEKADAEWIPFDTTTFFAQPPTSDGERDAWTKKPRMPLRAAAVTDRPIIRYLGRDDPAATVAGWQPWVPVVADWLREGRSPTVFLHTPDNAEAPALARRFHDDVRARVPSLEPLPTPAPLEPFGEPMTLF
jgi:uncharacterized protein YecE (DUF72 family)